MDKINIRNAAADFLVFTKENGGDGIEVRVDAENETIWPTQKLMADLFETSKQNISLHLKNIFESGELIESSVVKDSLTTGPDGKKYQTKHYNLDAVIAVGYRINSKRASRHLLTTMEDWTKRLDGFLVFNEMGVLQGLGTVSAEVAKEHALSEYSKFRVTQDKLFENAFDKLLELNEKENETISKQCQ